jgi:AcrR family transcriptional regulator
MSRHPAAEPASATRRPTLTERARRAQLIAVTIEVVARHGYAGTSLARIAERAEISKATVLYHFPSKDAVVRAAYATVIEALTGHVGAAVAPLSGAAAVETYIHSLVGYMRDHPDHARTIIAAMTEQVGVADRPETPSRWQAVAAFIEAAKAAGDYRSDIDSRAVAITVNGAIDAIVAEQLADPGFDSTAAADQVVDLLRRALHR